MKGGIVLECRASWRLKTVPALALSLLCALCLFVLPAAGADDSLKVDISVDKQTLSPGETVRVTVDWTGLGSDTDAVVRCSGGSTSMEREIEMDSPAGTALVDFTLGQSASLGTYTVKVDPEGYPSTVLANAFTVQVVTEAAITSPTRSSPAAQSPGDSVTVKYDYRVTNDTAVNIHLIKDKKVVDSAKATLKSSGSSGSVNLNIPTDAAFGKYDLTMVTEAGATLATQQAAVIVAPEVRASITEPTRSDPFSRHGGEKVTIEFRYTSSAKTTVDVKLQKSSNDVLVKSSATLDKTARYKSKSATLTIPKDAALGKYDVVIEAPVSGKTLDSEREAVLVDAKISAEITSPTKTKPGTVKAGDSVSVKFDYTANMDAEVEVKVLESDGSVLASRTATVDRTTKKKGRTVSVGIPSRAAAGKYDIAINSKYSDKLLSSRDQAVIVEDPVDLAIETPTRAEPARFNTAGKFEVRFVYTAATNSSIRLNVLRPDGKVLVSKTVSLRETSRTRTETAEIKLPSNTPLGRYDLEVINRDTENELALEPKAVQMVSYPLGVQVRLVIGQTGRWVNGDYQPVDMAPRIIENRTLLPIRHVGEPLGWQFNWDNSRKQATVTKGEMRIRVRVNDNNAQISDDNGQSWRTVRIDPANRAVQPVLISGRVLLPLRFVGETLDTRVDWNAAARAVTVTQ